MSVKVHIVPVWLPVFLYPPIEIVSVFLLQSFLCPEITRGTPPVPVWCRCHCATPGRAPHSKYKAELRHPEAVRKTCLDRTSGPWERHTAVRGWHYSFYQHYPALLRPPEHITHILMSVWWHTQWKRHHTNPKVPLYSHAPPPPNLGLVLPNDECWVMVWDRN